MNTVRPISSVQGQRGFSLIELLVAMALGLSLLGVVGLVYQNLNSGQRLARAQQQMNQDAQTAFQILAAALRDTGFNPLQPRDTTPAQNSMTLAPGGLAAGQVAMGVFGCDFGFANGAGAVGATAADIRALTCNAAPNPAPAVPPLPSGSIAVQYEADQFNAATAGTPPLPADCRGFAVAARNQPLVNAAGVAAGNAVYYVVENRYYIANGGLSCTGNGGANAFGTPTQPLVMNVETLQISYGVKAPNAAAPNDRMPNGYLSATEIGPAAGVDVTGVHAGFVNAVPPLAPDARWGQVTTARICVVVASPDRVYTEAIALDPTGPIQAYYFGCRPEDNVPIAIRDGRARKAYVMHVGLRNRINLPN